MKKIKLVNLILACFLVLTLLFFTACSADSNQDYIGNNKDQGTDTSSRDDRVTIYTYVDPEDSNQHYDNDTMFYYPILQMAHMYNNYCSMNGVGERAVEVVKFPSRDRMIQQMSTEIMAGGGPDIILLDNELPISKLVNQGAFADLNTFIENDKSENRLNLKNYNRHLLETGVFNGKRYIMPMLYRPDVLISNTKVLSHYKVDSSKKLTYSNLMESLKTYMAQDEKISFLEGYESSKDLLLQYINDNVDREKAKTDFESKDFKQTVQSIKKLITKDMEGEKTIHSVNENNCLFEKGGFDSEGRYFPINYSLPNLQALSNDDFSIWNLDQDLLDQYAQEFYSKINPDDDFLWEDINRQFEQFVMENESDNFNDNLAMTGKTTLMDGITKDKNSRRGEITCGFMINGNSSKELQENAYDFMKYSLGERMQRYVTYDSTYSTSKASDVPNIYNLPVNNEALKTSYSDIGISEKKIKRITKNSSFLEKIINHSQSLNTFVIKDGYYNKNVIGGLVEDFLQDKISLDNFITNLKSKTEIYLYE